MRFLKGGRFLKCVNLENIGVQYHLFRQLWLFLGIKLMEIHRNLFSRKLICFCGNRPIDPQRTNGRDWKTILQKTMTTLSFKGEVIFHLVMALWHFFTGIYKKLEEIWRFIADICKKLEEMEPNILLWTTRDDVKIHEET